MKRIDRTVLTETKYIAFFTIILSIIMESVFLIIGKWDYTVLLGNLLGFIAAIGNFFLMALTVQSAFGKEEKEIKTLVKLSQTGRLFLLFVVALIGHFLSVFNIIAVVIPFLFPRIAITLRQTFIKNNRGE